RPSSQAPVRRSLTLPPATLPQSRCDRFSWMTQLLKFRIANDLFHDRIRILAALRDFRNDVVELSIREHLLDRHRDEPFLEQCDEPLTLGFLFFLNTRWRIAKKRTAALDRFHQFIDAVAFRCDCLHDRSLPSIRTM